MGKYPTKTMGASRKRRGNSEDENNREGGVVATIEGYQLPRAKGNHLRGTMRGGGREYREKVVVRGQLKVATGRKGSRGGP